jgi:hypothetical protein
MIQAVESAISINFSWLRWFLRRVPRKGISCGHILRLKFNLANAIYSRLQLLAFLVAVAAKCLRQASGCNMTLGSFRPSAVIPGLENRFENQSGVRSIAATGFNTSGLRIRRVPLDWQAFLAHIRYRVGASPQEASTRRSSKHLAMLMYSPRYRLDTSHGRRGMPKERHHALWPDSQDFGSA